MIGDHSGKGWNTMKPRTIDEYVSSYRFMKDASRIIHRRMHSLGWSRFDAWCLSWMNPSGFLRQRAVSKAEAIYQKEMGHKQWR